MDFTVDIDPELDNKIPTISELVEKARETAEQVAAIARSTAPHESGDYADSIIVQKTHGRALISAANFRVVALDHKSAWIEFGVPNRGIPAKFILRNAAKAAGLKFRKRSS